MWVCVCVSVCVSVCANVCLSLREEVVKREREMKLQPLQRRAAAFNFGGMFSGLRIAQGICI